MSPHDFLPWLAGLGWRAKVIAVAAALVVVELGFRRFARESRAYRRWTAFFEAIGAVWTAILLALVYLVSVGPIGLVMRALGNDPLDRRLAPEPSFWRDYSPNPLGPEQAARHQF